MRNGTAVNQAPVGGSCSRPVRVLDDGYAGGKQQCVRGPLTVGGVVDVERVDADECGVMGGEPGRARPGQEVPVFGVGR